MKKEQEYLIGGNAKDFVEKHKENKSGIKRFVLEQMLKDFAIEQVKLFYIPDVINWVAITEKMPESGRCVLIYSKNGGVAEGAYLSAKGHFKQWRWNAIMNDVTHWAQLPIPPCL